MQTRADPDPSEPGGLILFVYWLVKDRRLLFAPWRQRDSAVMLVLYGIFGISLSQFLYFLTIQFSNAAIGTIMQDLSPVMVLLVAARLRTESRVYMRSRALCWRCSA